VRLVPAEDLHRSMPPAVIFVDTSQDFAGGHVPGSRWVPRGWLEIQIADLVPSKETPVAVCCNAGVNSVLAGATLKDMGYRDVSVLDGGMAAWSKAGLAEETGLTGLMASPTDVVILGVDRNPADMMNYLRWETALGEKYTVTGD
jgi:rhodanese-related sulfurtransferase